jgi:hypothetical protein
VLSLLAVIDSSTYHFFLVLHIIAAVVAFGPLFLYPRLQRNGETATVAALHMKLVFPALIVLWVLGMALAGIGKYDFAETQWLTGAIVVWLAAVLVSWFLIRPSITDSSESARKKMSAGVGITHLLLVIALWLMVFQPGGNTFN